MNDLTQREPLIDPSVYEVIQEAATIISQIDQQGSFDAKDIAYLNGLMRTLLRMTSQDSTPEPKKKRGWSL